jgi:hypothetical protein
MATYNNFRLSLLKSLEDLGNCQYRNPMLLVSFGDDIPKISIHPCLGYLDDDGVFNIGGNVKSDYPYIPKEYITYYRCVSSADGTEELVEDPWKEEYFLKWSQSKATKFNIQLR